MTRPFPSGNPANLDTLIGAFREISSKTLQNIDGLTPCRVISYTAGPPPRVQVQPFIQLVTTDGQLITRAQIASVPVIQLGAGGFLIHFPIKAGDLGWLLATDRDISTFLQNYTNSPPATQRIQDFSSSLFIPDIMHDYTVSEEDAENCVIQSVDGTVKLTLSTNTITLSAPNIIIEDT